MKDRILDFLKAENKSSSQLAEEIGVQPSGISHILSGRNKPSLDFILKMLEKYPFLSTEWLLFGKGEMYREHSMQELFSESKERDENASLITQDSFIEPGKHVSTEKNTINTGKKENQEVEKIVWFYKDKSFREYFPGNE